MAAEQGSKGRGLRFKSTDGTVFWVNGESCLDYVLHPVFLHYFTICLLVFSLLGTGTETRLVSGWHHAISWAIVAALGIGWIATMTWVQRWLWRRRWLGLIYTPVFLVPMVLIVDLSREGFARFIGGAGEMDLSSILITICRDVFVVLLFDILHGRYVTLAHPNAMPESTIQRRAPLATPSVAPAIAPPPAPAEPAAPELLRIGTGSYAMADLLIIRTQGHRLEITTRRGITSQRARMSDIAELQDARHGMQINRSVWVAYDAIASITDSDGAQIELHLRSGAVERVARPRLHAFRQAWRARSSADPKQPDRPIPARIYPHAV